MLGYGGLLSVFLHWPDKWFWACPGDLPPRHAQGSEHSSWIVPRVAIAFYAGYPPEHYGQTRGGCIFPRIIAVDFQTMCFRTMQYSMQQTEQRSLMTFPSWGRKKLLLATIMVLLKDNIMVHLAPICKEF